MREHWLDGKADPAGQAHRHGRRDAGAALQEAGSACLLRRRHLVHSLCDGGDTSRPRPGRHHGSAVFHLRLPSGGGTARHSRPLLSTDGPRLSYGRWLVCRGPREPRAVLRVGGGRIAHGGLRDDRGGEHGVRRGGPHLCVSVALFVPSRVMCGRHHHRGLGEPTRTSRVRDAIRLSHLRVRSPLRRDDRGRCCPLAPGGSSGGRPARAHRRGPEPHTLPYPEGVLRGMLGHDRDRGHLQCGARLQEAREPQCFDDIGDHGRHPGLPAGGSDGPVPGAQGGARDGRERHDPEPSRARRLRQRRVLLLRFADSHHGHPLSWGQYQLCRISSSLVRARSGRLDAAAVHEPRRQAGLLQRDHRTHDRGYRGGPHLQGPDSQPDPALCCGRVCELHAVPIRDGAPLVQAADHRVETSCRDERYRRHPHGGRVGGDSGHKVHTRGLSRASSPWHCS